VLRSDGKESRSEEKEPSAAEKEPREAPWSIKRGPSGPAFGTESVTVGVGGVARGT